MKKVKLSKKQWSLKQRLDLTLEYGLSRRMVVYWVTLTSSPDSPNLLYSYKRLCQDVETLTGKKFEYCAIETSEGFGVLHCFWIFEGFTQIKAAWLHERWEYIHQAWNTSIYTIGGKGNDASRVAYYAVSQYAANQGTSFIKARWSRFSHMPQPLSKFIPACRRFLRGEVWHWSPWQVSYKILNECIRVTLRGGGYTITGQGYFDGRQVIYQDGEFQFL